MKPSLPEETKDTREATGWLAVLAWILVSTLAINAAYIVGDEVGGLIVSETSFAALVNGFGVALVRALPTFLFIAALVDFALLFGRCSDGDVFTRRNLKILRSGGETLLLAAAASAVISPTLLGWIEGDARGVVFEPNDLALGTAGMGLVIGGLALVFRDAVKLKEDNDQFI